MKLKHVATFCLPALGLALAHAQETKTNVPGKADQPPAASKPADEPAAPGTQPAAEAPVDTRKLVTEIGVEPGPAPVAEDQGAEAVISASDGEVTLRRTGTESFEALAKDTDLRAGDQIRTAAGASATLTLADQSTVEIAEDSAVAIGDRNATAEPGAAVAVLYGVARILARYRVSLQTARINTLGDRAEDVFLVSGEALSNAKTVLQLEQELLQDLTLQQAAA